MDSLTGYKRKMAFRKAESISIDYGVIEKSKKVVMIPASFDWSDVGSWSAVSDYLETDKQSNSIIGNVIDIGSKNTTIVASDRLIATIGLKNMVVVDTPDATLITVKGKTQEVREIVRQLKETDKEEYKIHKTVEKPWGNYTVIENKKGYKVKQLTVNPGAKLSLQRHEKRNEHWIIVEAEKGQTKVTKDSEIFLFCCGDHVHIPMNVKHRLENIGTTIIKLIEVSYGEYLGEDDIERFEDVYGR